MNLQMGVFLQNTGFPIFLLQPERRGQIWALWCYGETGSGGQVGRKGPRPGRSETLQPVFDQG